MKLIILQLKKKKSPLRFISHFFVYLNKKKSSNFSTHIKSPGAGSTRPWQAWEQPCHSALPFSSIPSAFLKTSRGQHTFSFHIVARNGTTLPSAPTLFFPISLRSSSLVWKEEEHCQHGRFICSVAFASTTREYLQLAGAGPSLESCNWENVKVPTQHCKDMSVSCTERGNASQVTSTWGLCC